MVLFSLLLSLLERLPGSWVAVEGGEASRVALGLGAVCASARSVILRFGSAATVTSGGVLWRGGSCDFLWRPEAGVVGGRWESAGTEWCWLMGLVWESKGVVSVGAAMVLVLGWRKREVARMMLRMAVERGEGIALLRWSAVWFSLLPAALQTSPSRGAR